MLLPYEGDILEMLDGATVIQAPADENLPAFG
jgi:hypothetical protein